MIYTHNDLLLLVVEIFANSFEIKSRTDRFGRHKFVLDNLKNRYGLPLGNYSIIGKLEDITEEQAKGVSVQHHIFKEWWKNWQRGWNESWFTYALDSLNSLIASLSIPLTETQTILILKQQ